MCRPENRPTPTGLTSGITNSGVPHAANHMAENRDLVQHRDQSLTVSHRARCKLLEDQLEDATNEKIRRMKEGELARANYGYERRIEELQRLADSADIHATLVVEGVIEVTRGDAP